MSTYTVDKNFKTTKLRAGGIVAFGLAGTAIDSGWYRLVPDGVTAFREEGDFFNITLDNIRADVEGADFRGWELRIANDGFHQSRRIIAVDGNVVTLDVPLFGESKLDPSVILPLTGIQYILIPHMLRDLNAYFGGSGSGECTIGYSARFLQPGVAGYSREVITGLVETPTIHDLGILAVDKNAKIPTAAVEFLFYKFSVPSADNRIFWGEQEIIAQGGGAGGGSRGGGEDADVVFGGLQFVDDLPDIPDAKFNVLYIWRLFDSQWRKYRQITTAFSPGAVTTLSYDTYSTFYDYLGEFDEDQDHAYAAQYFNKANNEFRRKGAGNADGSITRSVINPNDGDWLAGSATDPTADTTVKEYYYNSTANEFRSHEIGSSVWAAVAITSITHGALVHSSQNVFWGAGGITGTEHIDTLAEVLRYEAEEDRPVDPETFYFDSNEAEVYHLIQYRTPAVTYATVTAAVATDNDDILLLTARTAIAVIAELTTLYDNTKTYIFYSEDDTEIQSVTAFTAMVEETFADSLVQVGVSSFVLGPLDNAFTTNALRDAYATANAAWLALYDGNPAFLVSVTVSGVVTYYRRNGGAWQSVNGIIGLAASQTAINTAVAAAVAAAVVNFRTGTEITTEIGSAIAAGIAGLQSAAQVSDAITAALADYLTQAQIIALIPAGGTGGNGGSVVAALTSLQVADDDDETLGWVSGSLLHDAVRAHETVPWSDGLDAEYRSARDETFGDPHFSFEVSGGNTYMQAHFGAHNDLWWEAMQDHSVVGVLDSTDRNIEHFRATFLEDYDVANFRIRVDIPDDYADSLTLDQSYHLVFTQSRPDVGHTESELEAKIEDEVLVWARDENEVIPGGARFAHSPLVWDFILGSIGVVGAAREVSNFNDSLLFHTYTDSNRYVSFTTITAANLDVFKRAKIGALLTVETTAGGRTAIAVVTAEYNSDLIDPDEDAEVGLQIDSTVHGILNPVSSDTTANYTLYISGLQDVPDDPDEPDIYKLSADDVTGDATDIFLNIPSLVGYTDKVRIGFFAKFDSVGSVRVQVSLLNSISVRKADHSHFAAGEIRMGFYIVLQYSMVSALFISNIVPTAASVVDRLGDHDEDNHFFSVIPADLTEGKVGYAAAAYTGLNTAGGFQAAHSLVKGLFHEYDVDRGYRWHLLYDDDAMGIGGTDNVYGGPSLDALDGSGATGRILNMFFKVGDRANNRLFNPYGGGIDLDFNSEVRLGANLSVFEIVWNITNRRFEFRRHSFDTGSMSVYWDAATDPLNETKDIWVLTQNGGLVKIDADWFDDAGSTYVRWIVPDTEMAVLAGLNGIEDGQHCLVTVADEDSVAATPDFVRTYDHGFYLQLDIGSNPIETKWLKPASYSPGVWHWLSDWEKMASAPTVVGTSYQAAVHDVEGAGQYTAASQITLHDEFARKDELGPTFVTWRHQGMDNQFRNYTPYDLYPFDVGENSRENLFRPRKFIFGRVEGSSNGGLPIPQIDVRAGSRGNVDYHTGEMIGDDLLPLTTIRPLKGTWRFGVDMPVLTKQPTQHLSILLLRENTERHLFLDVEFIVSGQDLASDAALGLGIDSDGNAYTLVSSTTDRLHRVNLDTGEATAVGAIDRYGVSELAMTDITYDGTNWYTIGTTANVLYIMDVGVGRATRVGLSDQFGVGESLPISIAATEDADLYMGGNDTDGLLLLDKTTGVGSRVGTVDNYGLSQVVSNPRIFAIGNRLFMFNNADTDESFYELDRVTGRATLLSDRDFNGGIVGYDEYQGVIYGVDSDNKLVRSNVLDLPVSASEGVGAPVISKYNFPGYQGVEDFSVSGKMVSPPIYCDGVTDFTIVWELLQHPGEDVLRLDWLGRDFKVFMERLA